MMKTVHIIMLSAFVISSSFSFAQDFSDEDIIGKWSVLTSAVVIDTAEVKLGPEEKKQLEILSSGFFGASFDFRPDHTFSLVLADDIPDEMKDFDFMQNILWKLDQESNMILIGTLDDNYNHMRIKRVISSGQTLFLIADTPLALMMKRM